MRDKILPKNGFLQKALSFVILFSLLLINVPSTYAQNTGAVVSGKVSDEFGDALPGVNILIKDTSTGTVTDLDGNYSLKVPPGGILVFSFIGYKNKEVDPAGKTVVDFAMEPEVESLNEIVVVGFAEQKKASVVGSIVTTSGEDVVKAGGVTTVSEALTGLLPGVTTTQNAGIPGASQSDILIRGVSSWNNNSPLYLVDGIERDFNNIDPNEIESITVLKDASATAVFGARAGNGAIIVTTKSGSKGEVKVNFSANFGMKNPTTDRNYLADYATTLEHYNIAARNDRSFATLVPQETIDQWADPNRDPRLYTYTDWVNKLLKRGYGQSYNLNISGGNDFIKYFTSFGHNNDGDVFDLKKQPDFDPRTWQKRYNYRANIDIALTKTTELNVKLAGEITNWNGNAVTADGNGKGIGSASGNDRNLYLLRLFQWPMVGAPAQFDTGEFGIEPSVSENPNFIVRMEQQGSRQKKSNKLWTDFGINQDLGGLLKGLKFRGKLALNSFYQYSGQTDARVLQYYAEEQPVSGSSNGETEVVLIQDGDPEAVQSPPIIRGQSLSSFNRNLYYESGFDYSNKFGDHSVGGLVLFNRTIGNNGTQFKSVLESWVGRVTYDYQSKYFFEANGAYNGSEKFAPGKRFGFFPSAAVGWIVSNENFMDGIDHWLDHLKFRYSYGSVGAEKASNRFAYISVYQTGGGDRYAAEFGDPVNSNTQYLEGQVPNINATWETAVKQNLGIELGFFNSKLTANLDLYDERRTEIFFDKNNTTSIWAGFPSKVRTNTGETKSHGIELELNWKEVISHTFSYYLKANISFAENRVIAKDDPRFQPNYQKTAGKPIGVQTGLINLGYLDSWDEVYNTTESSWRSQLIPGDFQYVDYNADGILDQNDFVTIRTPDYAANAGAMTLGVTYKGLSAMVRFNGVFNISKNIDGSFLWEFDTRAESGFQLNNNEQLDYWTPNNLNAAHPALHIEDKHNTQRDEHTLRRADYLKLQVAEISYRLPTTKIGMIDSFEIYVNGNNLHTWTGIPSAFDPEAKSLLVYPISRRYNMGFRMSF